MPGYDWSYGRGEPRARAYDRGRPPREGGPRGVPYGPWRAAGYDRGLYGEAYEAYAPGLGGGRDVPPGRGWGGYGAGYGYARQMGYARGPFLPEQAYRRHPELDRAPEPRGGRWGYEMDDAGLDLDDGRILDAVRRRLYEDVWLDVDRIDVEVEDGVVTLRGEVDDFLEVRYAWDDAWEPEGVRGVVTQLSVRADEPQGATRGDLVPQTAHGTSPEPPGVAG